MLEPRPAGGAQQPGQRPSCPGTVLRGQASCYGEAIRLSPQMAQAHVNLGQTLQQEGQWDEALPWLRRATEIEPRSLVFLALLAEAAVERELFEEAIACYQRMLELDSKLAATHNALGWLLQEAGRLDESEEHLRRIVVPATRFRDRTRQSRWNSRKTGRFRRGRSLLSRGDLADEDVAFSGAGPAGHAVARRAAGRGSRADRAAAGRRRTHPTRLESTCSSAWPASGMAARRYSAGRRLCSRSQ